MQRIPEPELMEDVEQAEAYAMADFEEPHSHFIRLFDEAFGDAVGAGLTLDLGCGPGDIAMRFARAYPDMQVHGVDGSIAMLACGRRILAESADIAGRIELIHGMLPGAELPHAGYDAIISNSLLHHLHDPQVLWQAVKHYGCPGAMVFIMDLKRPDSRHAARRLVDTYAADEPEVLRRDFFHSLLAAFTPEEIRFQLVRAELAHLDVKTVSDRHITVAGRLGIL
jgi:ubiquinone/menaquinone biosynthesis C-methylase UbiE